MNTEDRLKLATALSRHHLEFNKKWGTKLEVLIPSIICKLIDLENLGKKPTETDKDADE